MAVVLEVQEKKFPTAMLPLQLQWDLSVRTVEAHMFCRLRHSKPLLMSISHQIGLLG